MSELLDILAARSGLICAVGAGGKKTTLYHLAATHSGRVGITSTVPISRFPETLGAHPVIANADEMVEAVASAAANHRLVAFAHPEIKRARYGGVNEGLIDEIRRTEAFDVLYVKGDGARMRWIKAPNDDEPLLPRQTTTLIPLVSARAIGRPLSNEVAHRLQRVSAVCAVGIGEPITPRHVARLLVAEDGLLKNAGTATVVPVINMVDDEESEALATDAARSALESTRRFDRVVLTSSRRPDRLVATLHR
jgi:probable selenium-dependent hydroxylase accessory protein YqeC